MKISRLRILGLIFLEMLLTIVIIFLWWKGPSLYSNQLLILLFCHLFMCICLIYIMSRDNFYVFEPIVFVTFMYYMIFVFTPIYDIFEDNVSIFGTNTMSGCIKGTIIFVAGFIALLIGYNSKIVCRKKGYFVEFQKRTILEYDKHSLLTYSYVVWGSSIAIYLLYNMMTGRNLLYMLSFGFFSQGLNSTQGYSVDFLSMIIYCSFVPMMNILIYDKSKLLKILVFLITCIPVATRGFRSVLIIPLMAPFIYRYIKTKKTPKIYVMGIITFIVIFMLGFIENTRGSMRVGTGLNIEGYSYLDGMDGILDYFGSYKTFYGAVMAYPSEHPYTCGQQLLYSIVMYIPRVIWPGKPNSLIQEVIGNSTNEIARLSGAAWPNIGEYYTDGGIIGLIFIMFILGWLLKHMKKMYENPKAKSSLIAYSLLLPALIPIIAYGYTAGNLPTIVFMMLPFCGEKYFVKKVMGG